MSGPVTAATEDTPMPTFTIVVDEETFRGEGSTRLEAFAKALEQAAARLRPSPGAERAPEAGHAARPSGRPGRPGGPSQPTGRAA